MKQLLYLVFITFIFIGCEGAYKHEDKFVVFEKGGRGEVDSIQLHKDTLIIYRSLRLYNADTVLMKLQPNIMDNATKTVYEK